MHNSFKKKLLHWHKENPKPHPWKNTTDPYKIWLSEIILQQTRIEQGKPYYLKFVDHFPTVHSLAEAEDDEVFGLWAGLGYYNRARNLLKTARLVSTEFNGIFPNTYDELLKLPGIGPYTAAAISSFAFGEAHAVVDGNVYRVLSRIFGIETPIDSSEGKKEFNVLANQLMDRNHPGEYNQAIMDFGADLCSPKSPACASCPFHEECVAFRNRLINRLPYKSKKLIRKNRYFNFLVFQQEDELAIEKRGTNDIWPSLYQFPMIESSELLSTKQLLKQQHEISNQNDIKNFHDYSQKLTHQNIHARFFQIRSQKHANSLPKGVTMVSVEKIDKFAFPKIVGLYLEEKILNS